MRVETLCKQLKLDIVTKIDLTKEVEGVYIGDLLSIVMSHAKKGDLWLTVQTHINVIAIASLLELSAIVIVEGQIIDDDALIKANDENIIVLRTEQTAYELAKQLANLI